MLVLEVSDCLAEKKIYVVSGVYKITELIDIICDSLEEDDEESNDDDDWARRVQGTLEI